MPPRPTPERGGLARLLRSPVTVTASLHKLMRVDLIDHALRYTCPYFYLPVMQETLGEGKSGRTCCFRCVFQAVQPVHEWFEGNHDCRSHGRDRHSGFADLSVLDSLLSSLDLGFGGLVKSDFGFHQPGKQLLFPARRAKSLFYKFGIQVPHAECTERRRGYSMEWETLQVQETARKFGREIVFEQTASECV